MNEDPAEAFLGFVCASMWRDRVVALPGRLLTDPEGLETRRGTPWVLPLLGLRPWPWPSVWNSGGCSCCCWHNCWLTSPSRANQTLDTRQTTHRSVLRQPLTVPKCNNYLLPPCERNKRHPHHSITCVFIYSRLLTKVNLSASVFRSVPLISHNNIFNPFRSVLSLSALAH